MKAFDNMLSFMENTWRDFQKCWMTVSGTANS